MGGNSEAFWLPLKALVSVEEPVNVQDAPIRNAWLCLWGREDKPPSILLVFG